MSQGGNAVKSGKELENKVQAIFDSYDFSYEKQVPFMNTYNLTGWMDFVIDDIAIECKNQNGTGTVDQKFPFVYDDLCLFPSERGLVVLGGSWYTKGPRAKAIHWYLDKKKKEDSTFSWCLIDDFDNWLQENL